MVKSNASVQVGATSLGLVIVAGILLATLDGHPSRLIPSIKDGNLLGALLTLALPMLLGSIVLQAFRLMRFGTVTLDVTAEPRPGGTFAATAVVPRSLPGMTGVETSLTLQHRVTRHIGSQPETTLTERWSNKASIRPAAVRQLLNRSEIPIAFAIPADLSLSLERGELRWDLTLNVHMPGPDLVQSFDLPVSEAPSPLPT